MRFGVCCTTVDHFPRIKSLGYDYVEVGFATITNMEDEKFEILVEGLKANDLKAEAANGFFPGDKILTGPDADHSFIPEYVEKGMARFKSIGGKVAVLGSGKARNIPEGFDHTKGEEQFIEVLKMAGDIAAKYGIKIVIEPLNANETNLINTVQQSLDIIKRCNHPNIYTLADFFHVFKSGETMEAIETAGELLQHTHLARADADRQMPRTPEDYEACKVWAAALKKCGYNARMSLEGSFKPEFTQTIEDVLPALNIFKNIVG
ncbi:MAG: sugar phosphate isomerase/epimerase [Clostridia bacterium]|nr:sugar phosphate isomerase/epimerase [Clostridia bacterium]